MMMRSTKTTTDMRVQSHESNLLTGGVPSSLNAVYSAAQEAEHGVLAIHIVRC
jgi:hypothetical protein